MWTIGLLGFALLAAPPSLDATGLVVGEDGKPVAGVQVCEVSTASAGNCVFTNADGVYKISHATHPKLLLRLKGFLVATADAAPLSEPIKLQRAAALRVTIIDIDTRRPVQEGRVMLDQSTGKRIGDYVPFNQAGVRISTLEPGVVFVRAEAKGYEAGGPVPVELSGGAEGAVTITMKKKSGNQPH